MQANRFGDLPADAMQRVEAGHRLLKDYAGEAAARAAEHVLGRADQAVSVEQDATGRIAAPRRQQLKQRQRRQRLAGPALPNERQGLAAFEGEGNAVHDSARSEGNGEIRDFEQAHVGILRGSKASRTASPTKISSTSTPPSTTKAVKPSHGACRLSLP